MTMTTTTTTPKVRAMNARYDGWCGMGDCHAEILRGSLIYRVDDRFVLCHRCGRAYVDALPMPPRGGAR